MRRALITGIASLLVAALVAPTAQAATRRYDFQVYPSSSSGGLVSVAVFYKNKQRHGQYTPRQAIYKASDWVPCNPPGNVGLVDSGSYIPGTPGYNRIKMRKGSFAYSYSSESVEVEAPPRSHQATSAPQRRAQ